MKSRLMKECKAASLSRCSRHRCVIDDLGGGAVQQIDHLNLGIHQIFDKLEELGKGHALLRVDFEHVDQKGVHLASVVRRESVVH